MMNVFLFFLFIPYFLFSEIVLNFPITSNNNKKFSVTIPSSFKEIFRNPNNRMVEYIPENEDLENWTEILTIESIPKHPGMLDFYLRKHKIAIQMLFTQAELQRSDIFSKIVEDHGVKVGYAYYLNPHYKVKTQTVDLQNMEYMGVKIVQGKTTLYRVAYNIKFPKNFPAKTIEEKIQSYLDQCIIIDDKLNKHDAL